jgi:hypothetical protein
VWSKARTGAVSALRTPVGSAVWVVGRCSEIGAIRHYKERCGTLGIVAKRIAESDTQMGLPWRIRAEPRGTKPTGDVSALRVQPYLTPNPSGGSV